MPRTSLAHKEKQRRRILLAACRCVVAQGFGKTSMLDVVRTSGLSTGAVYHYFDGKQELALAIADHALGEIERVVQGALAAVGPPAVLTMTEAVLTELDRLARRRTGDLTKLAVDVWAQAMCDPEMAAVLAERYDASRRHLTEGVRRCQAGGTVDPAAAPDDVVLVITGMLMGYVLQRQVPGDATAGSYQAGLRALTR